ncbi:hypothetical protein psal_cds_1310 [Pandoravirus salinus]|uniref:Uncharacterized protein n=1 Tax=Pandoravirus salinus TaxID=1349410 RepID=S4W4N7_9VIRU|nr:hypothetical protein psal_cds_1310 [Pandoravirus salinus]AGO85687.1 hypothetical protein psal_cds_1310 [Pandoravirus salinus]
MTKTKLLLGDHIVFFCVWALPCRVDRQMCAFFVRLSFGASSLCWRLVGLTPKGARDAEHHGPSRCIF